MTEAADTDQTAAEQADTVPAVTEAADMGQTAAEQADTVTAVTEAADTGQIAAEHPGTGEAKGKGQVNEGKVGKNLSGQSGVTKKMLMARKVKLLWEKFCTTRLACPEEKDLGRNQVTSSKEDISKCLNNTSRALFLKLRASAILAVDGLTCTLSFHLKVGLWLAIQRLDKMGTSLCVVECVKKLL